MKSIYSDGEIPLSHIEKLQEQIDKQSQKYKITEEEIDQSLALIKKKGFDEEEIKGKKVYTAEIIYHKNKEHLLHKKGLPLNGQTVAIEEDADFEAQRVRIENGTYVFDLKTPNETIKNLQCTVDRSCQSHA